VGVDLLDGDLALVLQQPPGRNRGDPLPMNPPPVWIYFAMPPSRMIVARTAVVRAG
jgi:hypothetical protein